MCAQKLLFFLIGVFLIMPITSVSAIDCAFINPLILRGQDPSAVFHDGYYYLVQSTAGQLTITQSATLTGLGKAAPVPVYVPPSGQPYSYDNWAPELVYLRDHWYIYVAATNAPGANPTHRMFVLEADTDDPLGTWTMRGQLTDPTDKWAIDGVVFEYEGQIYTVWSGWPGDVGDFPQNLYIARMSDPLTIDGERHLISAPDQLWEKSVAAINEGPEAFIHDGQLSIVYSADASWTAQYKLGLLKLTGDDPLDSAAWEKIGPVFSGYDDARGAVYGVGHNSMPVTSPDGSESWLLFHSKTVASDGWDDRAIFAQKFTWNDDGTPNFGQPTPAGVGLTRPAGEACGEVIAGAGVVTGEAAAQYPDGVYPLAASFVDTGANWIDTLGSFTVSAQVKLDSTNAPVVILSQDGGISSNFALEYDGQHFAFTRFDGLGRESESAVGTTTPAAGEWVHLVGVHDLTGGTFRLYVDGVPDASADATITAWDSRGSFIIGAGRKGPKRVNPFSGTIKDVRIFNGALSDAEVASLSAEGESAK